MADSLKKRLSLDTDLLLDLAQPEEFAHDFREEFQGRGYALMLAPTVLFELEYLLTYGEEPRRRLARRAVEQVAAWQITPFDLSEVSRSLAERFSVRLREKGLLPEDEVSDGLILGETSLGGIPLLVTSDGHLLDVDEKALLVAFQDADLQPVHAVHPKRLLKALR